MRSEKKGSDFGFTLIELLTTIAVIVIISAVGLTFYSSAQAKARDGKRKSDLQSLKFALQLYHNDNNQYPSCNGFVPDVFGPSSSCHLDTSYIKEIPHDPKAAHSPSCPADFPEYYYEVDSSNQNYTLYAKLEVVDSTQTYSVTISGGKVCEYNYKIENS